MALKGAAVVPCVPISHNDFLRHCATGSVKKEKCVADVWIKELIFSTQDVHECLRNKFKTYNNALR